MTYVILLKKICRPQFRQIFASRRTSHGGYYNFLFALRLFGEHNRINNIHYAVGCSNGCKHFCTVKRDLAALV